MIDRTDQDVCSLLSVEDVVRLKTKTTMWRRQFIDCLSNAREVREETKCPFQAGEVGLRLILSEGRNREVVDVEKL
jgi:hypothetical protein